MIAIDWSWSPLIASAVVLAVGGYVLRFIRDHGPDDPVPWEPEGEE